MILLKHFSFKFLGQGLIFVQLKGRESFAAANCGMMRGRREEKQTGKERLSINSLLTLFVAAAVHDQIKS